MSLTALAIGFTLLSQPKADVFAELGPYDRAVPRPESVLGYGPGERHSTFRDLERVVLAIAEKAPDRVRLISYGTSTEGRPLRICVVSSPENMKRLEQIRQDNLRVAEGKPGPELDALAARTPAIVWINECIHGDETASFESGMWLLYNLAASRNPELSRTLENAVVIVNPVFNPDGHERFVVWYNSVATGSASPDAFERAASSVNRGRANHYRFDMNRDHVSLSQEETRQEVRELQRWYPQVYVDQHGQLHNYFFPPNPMSVNVNVDRPRFNRWTQIFGEATASEFDKRGWLYFVRQEFDFYFAGYTDTWAGLTGSIGMTHETDHGASIRELRDDGSEATLRGAMEKHFVSAIAVISATASKRKELVGSFLKFRRDAASGVAAGKFRRVVVASEDLRPLQRLQTLLNRHGIASRLEKRAFRQEAAHDYWTGKLGTVEVPAPSLVVDTAQPQGVLAKALLEPHSDFEPEFVKEQLRRRELAAKRDPDPDAGSYEFYDMTGWSLIYGFGLQAWWCEEAGPIAGAEEPVRAREVGPANIGYALRYRDVDDGLAVFDLLEKGLRVHVAKRELKSGSMALPAGTILVFRDRNGDDMDKVVLEVARRRRSWVEPLATGLPATGGQGPGSGSVRPVRAPSVAIVFGDTEWMAGAGALWWLFEREWKLPFTPLRASALNRDLSEYTCIVLPQGRFSSPSPKLREWVQAGGCAVVAGNPGWAVGSGAFAKLDVAKLEGDKPIAPLPGSLFLGRLDPRSFLAYGFPVAEEGGVRIAVPVDGSTYYKAAESDASALTLPKEPASVKLLSGWIWPDESPKALAGTAWAHVERVGAGSVVLFMNDPAERAMWPAQWKMLLNAILFGPG